MHKYGLLSHSQIFKALNRQLKTRVLHYGDVAKALGISESTVRRWFAQERLTLEQLAAILNFLNMTLTELGLITDDPPLRMLTLAQEEKLVSDQQLLLVASLTLRHWSLADIVAGFKLTKAQCIKHLLTLERLRLIDLLPENRIRLRTARDFLWQPKGPIRALVKDIHMRAVFDYPFDGGNDLIMLKPAYLTATAIQQLKGDIQRLQSRVVELERESLSSPPIERIPAGVVATICEWDAGFLAEYRHPRPSTRQEEDE